MDEQHRTGTYHTAELHQLLADERLARRRLAEGVRRDRRERRSAARALFQEITATGLHLDGWSTTDMIAKTLLHVGTEDQKREYVGGRAAR